MWCDLYGPHNGANVFLRLKYEIFSAYCKYLKDWKFRKYRMKTVSEKISIGCLSLAEPAKKAKTEQRQDASK